MDCFQYEDIKCVISFPRIRGLGRLLSHFRLKSGQSETLVLPAFEPLTKEVDYNKKRQNPTKKLRRRRAQKRKVLFLKGTQLNADQLSNYLRQGKLTSLKLTLIQFIPINYHNRSCIRAAEASLAFNEQAMKRCEQVVSLFFFMIKAFNLHR